MCSSDLFFFRPIAAYWLNKRGIEATGPTQTKTTSEDMGEVVNIRTARKKAAKRRAEVRAAENRLTYGRSKAERARGEAHAEKARRDLEGHRLGREDER